MARVPPAIEGIDDPMEKLTAWIRAHATMVKEYRLHVKVFFTEIDQLPASTLRQMVERRDVVQNMLEGILASGVASGKIRPDVNPNISSFLILGMINWIYVWYRPQGPATFDEIVENILLLVHRGLSPGNIPEHLSANPTP
jgi:hypothetical protein